MEQKKPKVTITPEWTEEKRSQVWKDLANGVPDHLVGHTPEEKQRIISDRQKLQKAKAQVGVVIIGVIAVIALLVYFLS